MSLSASLCQESAAPAQSPSFAEWFDHEAGNIIVCDPQKGGLVYANPSSRKALSADASLAIPLGQMLGEMLGHFRMPCAYTSLQTNWGLHKVCSEAYALYSNARLAYVLCRWEPVRQSLALVRAVETLECSIKNIDQTLQAYEKAEVCGVWPSFEAGRSGAPKSCRGPDLLPASFRRYPRMRGVSSPTSRFPSD